MPFLHFPWQETLAVWGSTFQEALTVAVITSTDSMYICSHVETANTSGKRVCVMAVLQLPPPPHTHAPPHRETRQQEKSRRETESVTFVLIFRYDTHVYPPPSPLTHTREGQHHKVLGHISGKSGTWEVCCVFNPHGEKTLHCPFFISMVFTLCTKSAWLHIWKERIGTRITFPQGKHRIQDCFQMCQEDRLPFIGFLCMLKIRENCHVKNLSFHTYLSFFYTRA